MMVSSWSAKMLAVRRVTQDNRGKKTAGVDGIKSLTPKQRLQLALNLELNQKAQPIRRVWIPKPGKREKRPLGIPVMKDRALMALVKLALEPEWEARFEPGSFGFRPGRSAHDAIGAIFQGIRTRQKYVLDADIQGCFDNINHEALLQKINTYPKLRRVIKSWLHSGVMENYEFKQSEKGTMQGGVISPLLANIALDGLEKKLKDFSESMPQKGRTGIPKYGQARRQALNYVRYADDFVVMHPHLEVIEGCQKIIKEFLGQMGLKLNPEKTGITHTLEDLGNRVGFDFLGFTVRQFPVGIHQSGKDAKGNLLGFKTIIKPSKKSLKRHTQELSQIINTHKDSDKASMIKRLNLVIRGWCNYFSTVCSGETFAKAKDNLYHQIRRWVRKRHGNRSIKKANREYQTINGRNWVLATDDGLRLLSHIDTKITRHILVKYSKSPYDGDWLYWSQRLAKYPWLNPRVSKALVSQKGKCAYCGSYFQDADVIEIHHKDKNHYNNNWSNLCAVHGHCHDAIHGDKESERDSVRPKPIITLRYS